MKLLRAIVTGIILWVLIFFEVSILIFGFGLDKGFIYYIIHYILLALFTVLVSLIYFRWKGLGEGLRTGLFLGVIFVLVATILDLLITVPLFVRDFGFFDDIYLWFGFVEVIVISIIVGILRG